MRCSWLGVSPDVQRLGVGKKLYLAFEELMMEEKVRMLIIDTQVFQYWIQSNNVVQADNIPAIKFFTSMGFGSQSDHFYFSRKAQPIPESLLMPSTESAPRKKTRASVKKSSN